MDNMCKRKKIIKCMCMYLCGALLCVGCQNLPYADEIPMAYPDTRWVSEEPDIWFENPEDRTDKYLYGKAMTPDGEVEIAVDFATFDPEIYVWDIRTSMYAEEDDEEPATYLGFCMLSGTCVYSSDECIVRLETDNWFGGEYETIVFKRESIEEKDSE